MTRVLSLWLALIALLIIGCEKRKPVPPLDNRHVITVEGTTVRYNGKQLRWDMPADKWEEVLGPPNRQSEFATLTWDEIGVFLSQTNARKLPLANYRSQTYTQKKKIKSFSVLLGRKMHSPITKGEPDFWPKQTFSGRLIVDGALIHKNSIINEINHDKKGTSFSHSRLYIYNYELGDYHFSLEFGHDRTLTQFSVGKRVTVLAAEEAREAEEALKRVKGSPGKN